MKLQNTIQINKQIMALIESKYGGDPPLNKSSTEFRYYYRLDADNEKAEIYLKRRKGGK